MLSCQLFEDKERSLLHEPWSGGEWPFNNIYIYIVMPRNRSRDSSVGISARLRVGSIYGRGKDFFFLSKTSGPDLGLNHFLVGTEGFFPKGKA